MSKPKPVRYEKRLNKIADRVPLYYIVKIVDGFFFINETYISGSGYLSLKEADEILEELNCNTTESKVLE